MAEGFRRVLLKLSGEALAGENRDSIHFPVLEMVAQQISEAIAEGVQVAIVVGGGNIWRGGPNVSKFIEEPTTHYMGMLATTINALALQGVMEQAGIYTRVQSAIHMEQVAEPYIRRRAIRHLEKGRAVIFAGGTGNPFFTTDTAAALRATEIEADILYKATKVDGVYSADPMKDPLAKKYDQLTYKEVLGKGLRVMDSTAISLCMENNMPICVFNMFEDGAITRALQGETIGTKVSNQVETEV